MFTESFAFRKGKFLGLALDEDNQEELTGVRVIRCLQQIKKEFFPDNSIHYVKSK